MGHRDSITVLTDLKNKTQTETQNAGYFCGLDAGAGIVSQVPQNQSHRHFNRQSDLVRSPSSLIYHHHTHTNMLMFPPLQSYQIAQATTD